MCEDLSTFYSFGIQLNMRLYMHLLTHTHTQTHTHTHTHVCVSVCVGGGTPAVLPHVNISSLISKAGALC